MSHPRNPDRRARRGAIGGDGFAAGGGDVDVAMEASMPKKQTLGRRLRRLGQKKS
jgi:hypothetical protein